MSDARARAQTASSTTEVELRALWRLQALQGGGAVLFSNRRWATGGFQ
jgi:hypothetical protein